MRILRGWFARSAGLVTIVVLAGALTAPSVAWAGDDERTQGSTRQVLLISVDGLHSADLMWYVAHHPGSALATLAQRGVSFANAKTPFPSDSFPGLLAQVTGGNPASTGVAYDDTFNHAVLPAGTTSCPPGQPTGAEVAYAENLDRDPTMIDAGEGLIGLPASILGMTGSPQTLIDPAKLPVDPKTCTPIYPHQYLRVNTIFEVARAHGLRTAWSDKHPAYEILNGPSGTGVQDLFTPEINSQASADGQDWTKDNARTQQYDGYKAQAVRNQIEGFDHSRAHKVGTPAIFGMNFQSVSTAQKLPTSGGLAGGYQADGQTPGPVLSKALDFVDAQIGTFLAELRAQHLTETTTIILSAKHGQSPTQPAALTRIDDEPILAGLDTAWQAAHPGAGKLVEQATDDDGMLLWLTDRSPAAAELAKTYLLVQHGQGNDITGNPRPFTASGLAKVFPGRAAADFLDTRPGDPALPDLIGIAQHGVVYTGGKGKIAEHGGADPQDRDVPILVTGPGIEGHAISLKPVETTQIAPTILALLGLAPAEFVAVQHEHTKPLPLGPANG